MSVGLCSSCHNILYSVYYKQLIISAVIFAPPFYLTIYLLIYESADPYRTGPYYCICAPFLKCYQAEEELESIQTKHTVYSHNYIISGVQARVNTVVLQYVHQVGNEPLSELDYFYREYVYKGGLIFGRKKFDTRHVGPICLGLQLQNLNVKKFFFALVQNLKIL